MYLAASGAQAYEKRLQIISNNLANANTAGFKMDCGQFKGYDPGESPFPTNPADAGLAASRAALFWMQLNMYTDYSGGPLKPPATILTWPWWARVFSASKRRMVSALPAKVTLHSIQRGFW